MRALLRILYPIPDATSCKLQLNTFILWKAHCAMRVAANIVLLMSRCSTRTSKDARTELVDSCVNSLIECLNGTLESVAP